MVRAKEFAFSSKRFFSSCIHVCIFWFLKVCFVQDVIFPFISPRAIHILIPRSKFILRSYVVFPLYIHIYVCACTLVWCSSVHDTSASLTPYNAWHEGKFSESPILQKYYCSWVTMAPLWLQQFIWEKILLFSARWKMFSITWKYYYYYCEVLS